MTQKPRKNKLKSRLNLVLAAVFFALTTLGLVSLGVWQLNRATEKQHLAAQSLFFMNLPIQTFTPTGAYPEWQQVVAEGRFDPAREVVLESQPGPDGAIGYRIVTPLLVGAHEVLVDRGWVARDFTPGFLKNYLPQHHSFAAVVRRFPQRHGWLTGATESYGAATTLVFFDPAAIPQKPGVERLGYYLQATTPTHPAVKAFVSSPTQAITPEGHRQYALTWFSCAALWLACGVYYGFTALRGPAASAPKASGRKSPKPATRRGK